MKLNIMKFNIFNLNDIFSFPKVRANEMNLGDMAVYTSNVGIQVLYRCEYPTNVDISSQAFDVQVKVYNKIKYQRPWLNIFRKKIWILTGTFFSENF